MSDRAFGIPRSRGPLRIYRNGVLVSSAAADSQGAFRECPRCKGTHSWDDFVGKDGTRLPWCRRCRTQYARKPPRR